MKKNYFFVALTFIALAVFIGMALSSCNSKNDPANDDGEYPVENLIGTWKWGRMIEGYSYVVTTIVITSSNQMVQSDYFDVNNTTETRNMTYTYNASTSKITTVWDQWGDGSNIVVGEYIISWKNKDQFYSYAVGGGDAMGPFIRQ